MAWYLFKHREIFTLPKEYFEFTVLLLKTLVSFTLDASFLFTVTYCINSSIL